jgi:MFS family permease
MNHMMKERVGVQQEGSLAWVVFLSFVATIGGFLFGFDSGVINGTVDALQKAFGSTAVGTGFSVSSMLIGCAVGAFFAATWGPVVWVMLGEMFPNQCRGAALAVCGLAGWTANFLVTMTFPVLLGYLDLGVTYMIYAAFGLVAWLFVRSFVEETKGKTLEEMSR